MPRHFLVLISHHCYNHGRACRKSAAKNRKRQLCRVADVRKINGYYERRLINGFAKTRISNRFINCWRTCASFDNGQRCPSTLKLAANYLALIIFFVHKLHVFWLALYDMDTTSLLCAKWSVRSPPILQESFVWQTPPLSVALSVSCCR